MIDWLPRADGVLVAHPPIQVEGSGPIPTSALQFWIEKIDTEIAIEANRLWHSRMPRFGTGCCKIPFPSFGAIYDERLFAIGIWSNPCARLLPQQVWMELRRYAIGPDCPENTASWMLAKMTKLLFRENPQVVKMISYQDLDSHTGTIYKAAGWYPTIINSSTSWDRPSRSRPREQSDAKKQRWEKDRPVVQIGQLKRTPCPKTTSQR